jgi:hypothetical protein
LTQTAGALPTKSLAELYEDRREWLERSERDLHAAKVIAEAPSFPDPGALMKHLQGILDMAADAACLAEEDRVMLADRARAIGRTAYMRFFEHVLEVGRACIRGENEMSIDSIINTAETLMRKLKKLHLDEEGLEGMQEKVELLLQTGKRGDSAEAKQDMEFDATPYKPDQRLFMRYVDPPVVVQVGKSRYRSVDWSLGGLLIGGIEESPGDAGTPIMLRFCVPGGKVYEDRATVVRHKALDKQLSLQLRRFGSAMVTLKKEIEEKGVVPVPKEAAPRAA